MHRGIAEFLLLVLGILLAFWIDAWWEGSQQAKVEARLLDAVAQEVAENRASLEEFLSDRETDRRHHQVFVGMDSGELAALDADSAGSMARSLVVPWTYDPVTGATSALLQTPPLDSAVDPKVRMLLGRWVRGIEDSREEGAFAFELANIAIVRLIEVSGEHFVVSGSLSATRPLDLAALRDDEAFVVAVSRFRLLQNVYDSEIQRVGAILDSLANVLGDG